LCASDNDYWKSESKSAEERPTCPRAVLADEIQSVSVVGIAACLDDRTDNLRWSERLGAGFSASLVLIGAEVFSKRSGCSRVLAAGGNFEPLAKNELAERQRQPS